MEIYLVEQPTRISAYLLFKGDDYYPSGGVHDFCAHSDSLEALFAYAKLRFGEFGQWWHIVARDTMKIVADKVEVVND